MNAQAVPGERKNLEEQFETANDRFKRSFGNWFWGSIIAATFIHFAALAFWPEMTAADWTFSTDEMEAIDLPPEIEIPPPPEQIARPATPVISEAEIDEDITIAPTTFEDNRPEDYEPPPATAGSDISAAPTFTPFTVRPELRNEREVQRALEREYPAMLRDAGIGGTVHVHFFISDQGQVEQVLVNQSSGHRQLDDAALRVAQVFQFSPALNRDQRVPVWISLPITFRTR
jgi:periplasmic protein TonB